MKKEIPTRFKNYHKKNFFIVKKLIQKFTRISRLIINSKNQIQPSKLFHNSKFYLMESQMGSLNKDVRPMYTIFMWNNFNSNSVKVKIYHRYQNPTLFPCAQKLFHQKKNCEILFTSSKMKYFFSIFMKFRFNRLKN